MKHFIRLCLTLCCFQPALSSANTTQYMTWDWEQAVHNISVNESIEMWGIFTNTADFSLGIEASGWSYNPGSLFNSSYNNLGNPYNIQVNFPFQELDFYYNAENTRLQPGESVRFLFAVLTPNENIAPGSYTANNFYLSLRNSPQNTDPKALSDFTVNVSAVPIPASSWLLISGLLSILAMTRRHN